MSKDRRSIYCSVCIFVWAMLGFMCMTIGAGYFLRHREGITRIFHEDSYIYELLGVVLLLCIPLGIKFMRMNFSRRLLKKNEWFYVLESIVRLFFPLASLGYGLFFYFVLSNESMLYVALIGGVSLIFVWPTRNRMERSLDKAKDMPDEQ